MRTVEDWVIRELIAIAGYADNGRDPALRFIWGQDAMEYSQGGEIVRYPISKITKIVAYQVMEWVIDHYEDRTFEYKGSTSITISVPIYKEIVKEFQTLEQCKDYLIVTPIWGVVFEGEPVWVLEGWLPASKTKESWESARYKWEPGKGKVDVLGDPPVGGYYAYIKRMNGEMGAPDCSQGIGQVALDYVRKLYKITQEDKLLQKWDCYRDPVPPAVVAEAVAINMLDYERDQTETRRKVIDRVKNMFDPMTKWVCHTPTSYGARKIFTGTE